VSFAGIDHLFTALHAQDVMLEAVTKHLQVAHLAMKPHRGGENVLPVHQLGKAIESAS